ncbi:MAG TPA: SMC-Scp complex subunit ScpB [Candidatus Didemnitutus sp.]|jgi:segregation and condensation protein B
MVFDLKRVLHVLLFASDGPLSVKDIQTSIARFHDQAATLPLEGEGEVAGPPGDIVEPAETVETVDLSAAAEDEALYRDVPALVTTAQIGEAMTALANDLQASGGDILLIEGANGWRLVNHPRFSRWVRLLRNEPPPVRLSPSSLETLAVVAYRQPVTRAEIEQIRGVSAEAGLAKLLERDLVQITGRADLPGRPIQYGTTDGFLEFIGIKSIDELPSSDVLSPRQIDSWLHSANRPRAANDSDMGLDETEETQMSLDEAAKVQPTA